MLESLGSLKYNFTLIPSCFPIFNNIFTQTATKKTKEIMQMVLMLETSMFDIIPLFQYQPYFQKQNLRKKSIIAENLNEEMTSLSGAHSSVLQSSASSEEALILKE